MASLSLSLSFCLATHPAGVLEGSTALDPELEEGGYRSRRLAKETLETPVRLKDQVEELDVGGGNGRGKPSASLHWRLRQRLR